MMAAEMISGAYFGRIIMIWAPLTGGDIMIADAMRCDIQYAT